MAHSTLYNDLRRTRIEVLRVRSPDVLAGLAYPIRRDEIASKTTCRLQGTDAVSGRTPSQSGGFKGIHENRGRPPLRGTSWQVVLQSHCVANPPSWRKGNQGCRNRGPAVNRRDEEDHRLRYFLPVAPLPAGRLSARHEKYVRIAVVAAALGDVTLPEDPPLREDRNRGVWNSL